MQALQTCCYDQTDQCRSMLHVRKEILMKLFFFAKACHIKYLKTNSISSCFCTMFLRHVLKQYSSKFVPGTDNTESIISFVDLVSLMSKTKTKTCFQTVLKRGKNNLKRSTLFDLILEPPFIQVQYKVNGIYLRMICPYYFSVIPIALLPDHGISESCDS